MNAEQVRETLTALLNLKEYEARVINNLNEVLERKEEALHYLLSSKKITKESLDWLSSTLNLEQRYLRVVESSIERAMEKVRLIMNVLMSGEHSILNLEFGNEVLKYNLEFYRVSFQELAEGRKIIAFFRDCSKKENELLKSVEAAASSKEFGEKFQQFWHEMREELKSKIEFERFQSLKQELEVLAEKTENINRRFSAVNLKRLAVTTAVSTPIIVLLTYGLGGTSSLQRGAVLGMSILIVGLAARLFTRR